MGFGGVEARESEGVAEGLENGELPLAISLFLVTRGARPPRCGVFGALPRLGALAADATTFVRAATAAATWAIAADLSLSRSFSLEWESDESEGMRKAFLNLKSSFRPSSDSTIRGTRRTSSLDEDVKTRFT